MRTWLPWLIVLVLLAVIWRLASAVIALEGRTYASETGLCYEAADYTKNLPARNRREACLAAAETRTSGWWHLYYAMVR